MRFRLPLSVSFSAVALPLSMSVLLGSSFARGAAPKPTNAELVIGSYQEFENLNILVSTAASTAYISQMVNRNALVWLDPAGKWQPQLAESIPTLENGGAKKIKDNGTEKLQVVWKIRKDAVWGDGTPITAQDFKLTWNIALSDKVSIGSKEIYSQVEKFEIDPKNPKIMTWTYTKIKYDYNQVPQFYAVPSHLEAAVFEKSGKEVGGYEKNTKYSIEPTNPGLYSGPYRVAEIKLGSHVRMVPNPKWPGAKPNIKSIVVRVIPNTATLEANLLSGSIHLANQQGMSFDQAVQFERRVSTEKLPYTVKFVDGLTYEHVDLNLDNPILKDVKVRQALVYGLDRQAMVKALFEGKQKVAHHFVNPVDPWYTDDPKFVTKYDYSPRKARSLLVEAGWKKGADGILQKDGKKLVLQFMTTSGNKVRENVQTFMKQQYSNLGIDVNIKNEPARVFFGETTTKRKFGALAMYAWISAPDTNTKQTFSTAGIPTAANGWTGQNYPGWSNPTIDKLVEQIDVEFSLEKRKELAKLEIREYTRELPVIPLYYRANVVVSPANLEGMTIPAHQFDESLHVEKWNLK